MPRPMKPRRIGALPRKRKFVPEGSVQDEVVIKLDEMEAIRLKDVEGLNQEQAAKRMHVSRQTYQLILESGRKKVAVALTEGRTIQIDGGHVTINICEYTCDKCGHTHSKEYEKRGGGCPQCGKMDERCKPDKAHCPKCCMRRRGL
ncbi:DUF134 domain-containing protein [Fusibacter sp. JL216-2]|uniref:DUF134 domain-containing protein n=1 Tax=Fusibacter sp. JL216-2 TaxID=3071453 RepID=UPI003D34695B